MTEQLESTGKRVSASPHDDSPIVAAEGVRHLTRLMAAAAQVSMEASDPDYPQLHRILSPYLQYGIPAADCSYLYAPVRSSHTYRIFGKIGTSRLFHVEVSKEIIPHLDRWTRFGGLEEFATTADGDLEIVLSREPQDGNWIPLPNDDTVGSVLIRQYYYDWDVEEPAQLNIERVGARYPPPPYGPERAKVGVALLHEFFDVVPAVCARAVESYYSGPADEIPFAPLPFGFKDLSYGMGHFRCRPDEAVILETRSPEADYWGFQLMDHQWEALDWNLRQSSLNGHQAVTDEDGLFRAVIAHRDPGVANWLDPAGHTVGLIAGRYFRPRSVCPATLRVVPFDAVAASLPADTAMVSAQQRQDALRRRMLSVRRRMCD